MYTKFESDLSRALTRLGITYQFNYTVITHRQKFDLDFFISSPMRAFVECFFLGSKFNSSLVKRRSEIISDIYFQFRGAFVPFLVTDIQLTKELKSLFRKEVQIISLNFNHHDPAMFTALEIKKFMEINLKTFKSKKKQKEIFNLDPIFEGGEFKELLLHFRAILKTEDYELLSKEIIALNDELESNHHTSAALRIGRTLEFVIFSLAKAWNVRINTPVIGIVDELSKDFKGVTKILIDYSYSEEKFKIDKKNKLKNQIKKISDKLTDLIFDIDNFKIQKNNNNDIPINYRTVLEEVKKKYASDELIRTEMNTILHEKYLDELQDLRNIAAHANISGKNKEIDDAAVKKMIKNLKIILFSLTTINDNIVNIS